MPKDLKPGRMVRTGAIAMVAIFAASCGYAKKDYVDSELARLRSEAQAGDQALSQSLSGRIDQVDGRVNALQRELQAFRTEYNAKIQQLEQLIAFDVPVYFEFAKAEIRPEDEKILDRFASVVKTYYPNAIVTVEGFTDPAGSVAYNKRLGKARAEAVKEYLTSKGGLDAAQVRTVSYGKARDRQVVPGAAGKAQGAQANRRVALVIDYSGPALEGAAAKPVTN